MKKLIFAAWALMAASVYVWADSAAFKSDSPDEYVVRKGDTLWDISETFLNSPWLWPEIWHVNPEIDNPHLIFPGDVVRLVYIDGEPHLTVDRTVKMAPGDGKLAPSVRVQPLDAAIPAVPLDRIASYLNHSRIVTQEEMEGAPYMLSGPDRRLIVGKGDIGYARGEMPEGIRNFGVFREEQTFVDDETGEVLGTHALGVGIVKLLDEADVSRVQVMESYQELRAGDMLLPSKERSVESIFYPSAPDDPIDAEILAVEGGVSKIGKMDIIIVDKGARDGLQVGNVLAGFVRGELIDDRVTGETVRLPDERAGLVMVFRTFEKLSFAIVMESERPMTEGDRLSNP